MSQFNIVNKEFYAIYEQDSGKPLVRRLKAEDHDNAWDVAETLGENLVDVVDIPPTGDVEFAEDDIAPKTWQMDRQELSVDWNERIANKIDGA